MGNTLNLCIPLKSKGKSSDICSHCQLESCSRGWLFNDDDRISPLSNDILLCILSMLRMKDVVKTSLLSRRWRNLWVDTPILNFYEPRSYVALRNMDWKRLSYVKWVNSVLKRHKGRYLKEFKIVRDLNMRHQKDIDSWLIFALARKVEHLELHLMSSDIHLDIHLDAGDNYVFPDRFLNFNGGKFDLNCLKSLSLINVEVSGEAINFVISNCPFIERLVVGGTKNLASLVISGPNSALKYLKINSCHDLDVLSISNFNLVSLDIQTVRDLTLADLPMLVDLSIHKFGPSLNDTLSQASSCLSQLEFLTLRGYGLKFVVVASTLDQLIKLKRLSLEAMSYGGESLRLVIPIVNACPLLEEFVLTLSWRDLEWASTRTTCEVEKRKCSSLRKNHSLKVFEFNGYYGCVSDDELIKYIVETALCLEKVVIDPREVWRLGYPYTEIEAINNATKQVEALKESESIPSHVHVFLRLLECFDGAVVVREIYPHTYTPLRVVQ